MYFTLTIASEISFFAISILGNELSFSTSIFCFFHWVLRAFWRKMPNPVMEVGYKKETDFGLHNACFLRPLIQVSGLGK